MSTRIYLVTEPDDTQRLIEATSREQAIRFAAHGRFTASPAKATDVARLMTAGVGLERAAKPAQEEAA